VLTLTIVGLMFINSIGNEPGMKSIVFLVSGKLPATAIGMAFDF